MEDQEIEYRVIVRVTIFYTALYCTVLCWSVCGQRSTELNIQLINFLGTSKYIQTMGKTYNAPQITLTQ